MKKLRLFFVFALIFSMCAFSGPVKKAFAGANQCTWTAAGGNTNWSTAANWSCSVGTVPADGYDLIFPYIGANIASVNDLIATNTYGGIWFSGAIPGGCNGQDMYVISGNGIRVANNITAVTTGSCINETYISAAVTMASPVTIDVSGTNQTSVKLNAVSFGTNDITVVSQNVVPATQKAFVEFLGTITGSGNITATGLLLMYGTNTTYSGNISITNGELFASQEGLGNTTGITTVGNGASLGLGTCASNITVAENIIFTGTNVTYGLGGPSAKLFSSPLCGGGGTDETYGAYYSSATTTLSGILTLNTNLTVGPFLGFILSGTINGAGRTVTLVYDATPGTYYYGGTLVLSASSNNSSTANGSYRNPIRLVTLSDSLPASTVTVGALSTVTITGARSDVGVYNGGTLKGTGTVAHLDSQGGNIAPGMSPGTLNTGNVTYDAATTHYEELGGTSGGSYDQLNVTGTVSLGSATLSTSLYGGFVPTIGNTFTIINNDGSDAITGTFAGLAQGGSVSFSGYRFTISYTGGTGNDVVLTSTYVPGPPGTGFSILHSNVILPAAITGFGVALLFSQRRFAKKSFRR